MQALLRVKDIYISKDTFLSETMKGRRNSFYVWEIASESTHEVGRASIARLVSLEGSETILTSSKLAVL